MVEKIDKTLKCPLYDKGEELLMKWRKKTLVGYILEQMPCEELVQFVRENE